MKTVVAWSSGKDAAWALHEARADPALEIVGVLTTLTEAFERVAMHGVRERLLDLQTEALGLPVTKVRIPSPCPNEVYEERMAEAMTRLRGEGVAGIVFGDLFLRDVREYRERQLEKAGMRGVFPIWHRDTAELAREMIASGMRAIVACVDPRALDASFAGRVVDSRFLADLPADVDPCGENGEFHTVVVDGPMFSRPIGVEVGEGVTRDGFVFADVIPTEP